MGTDSGCRHEQDERAVTSRQVDGLDRLPPASCRLPLRIRPGWRDPRPASGNRSDYAELSSRIRSPGLLQRRTAYYIATFTLTWAAFGAA